MRHLLTQAVVVQTRVEGAENDFGNPTVTWTDTEYLGRLEQSTGREHNDSRAAQVGEWLLFLLADAVIDGNSRVVADGLTFEVIGPPAVQRTTRGEHHIEARLRHVEGA